MKKYVFTFILVIFLIGCAPEQPVEPVVGDVEIKQPVMDQPDVEEMVVEVGTPGQQEDEAAMEEPTEPTVKEFDVRLFQFGYEPSTIEVNKGDKVIIRAHTSDVPHGFRIREFDVDLAVTSGDPNNPDVTEFIASEEGEFSFYCSIPCGRGHKSMAGKLIVKP